MADPWAEFADAPEPARKPRSRRPKADKADAWAEFRDATPEDLAPTGRVHDGDTYRTASGVNARLYGVDAFELNQNALMNGVTVPLGQQSRNALLPFAQPGATVTPTGEQTYGRPVVSLDNGGDAGASLLHDGMGIAAPEYLQRDPAKLREYMETERLARLNGRGAWSTAFQQPASFRNGTPDPWAAPEAGEEGKSVAVFWDEPLPQRGLRPEVAQGYLNLAKDFSSTPEAMIEYTRTNGMNVSEDAIRKFYSDRTRDGKVDADKVRIKRLPPVLTDLGDGTVGAAARGLADPINMLDELGAVVDSVVPGTERENVWKSDRRFGDILANNLDQNRAILDNDEANHYWARFGGQLASGLVLPGASVEGVGFAAGRKLLQAGGTRYAAEQVARRAVVTRLGAAGSIEGAAAGAGQGENWQQRVQGAAIGAPLGMALGAGAGVVAPKVAQLVGRPFSKMAGRDGEEVAGDFADGAVDTARAGAQNDFNAPAKPVATPTERAALNRYMPELMDIASRGDDVAADVRATLDRVGPDYPIATAVEDVRARHGESDKADPWAEFETVEDAPTQAMRTEADKPTLVGPETALEASNAAAARPAGLLDDVTDPERLAQAERIAPADVLPLPSNSIDGVDEAVRIDAGRVVPVRAPNEADALATRNLPSPRDATRTLPKKGPLDLVTFIRTNGGLRPEGGELQHYGITNAGRIIDFAQGEQRIGKLVDPDGGMNYDDAADLAWKAGYFPDSVERPTVREFLDAVEATHSGRSRHFLPEDHAEIDDFVAARSQREQVEASAQEGFPLAVDRGEPVDMADLDRNAAPVTAYEEWGENAPTLAGNLRLDKLDSPLGIKRALVATHQKVGGFDAATRGRITQAETKRLAAELGMTADDLLKRRKGQAFNAEQALAARQILARSATDLVNMAKRISRADNPGDEVEAAFKQAWLRHVAIQEQVSGLTAEAGRALAQFRQAADSRLADRVLPSLGDLAGGATRMKDVAERILDLERIGVGPGKINSFAAQALKPRWRDRVVELYINSLLSGPQTHAVNMLSNTMTAMMQIPESAAAAGIGAVRRAVRGNRTSPERVLFSEIAGRTAGLLQGTREGLREAARSFRTGDTLDHVTKVEASRQEAIGGITGKIVRIPTRLLTAEDELFKGMARRMELTGLAIRKARIEGLRGEDYKARVADLIANPSDEMLRRSFDYARYLTFQQPLSPRMQGVSKLTEGYIAAKWLVPFVRTPINLLKFAAERSPAAPFLQDWQKDVVAGGVRRDVALARALVGTGILTTFYQAALAGKITGGGPADEEAKRLMVADGWQPYSFKVGDRYVSYQRLDPYSTLIGTAADMVDLGSRMTEKQQQRSATLVVAAILNNLSSKTWLSGVSAAAEALDDPERKVESFIARQVGGIAVPTLVNQIARVNDPIMRDARGWIDRVQSRVPGLSDNLMPRRDAFGRPMVSEGGAGPDIISPIWTGTAKNDPTVKALLDAGAHVTAPSRKIGARELTAAEYDRYQQLVGGISKPQLDALVKDADWKASSAEEKRDAVSDLMRDARAEARGQLNGGEDAWAQFKDAGRN